MARPFTTKTIENIQPDPEKRREVPDPALPGLYVIVQPSGAKSWAVRYRHAGRPRKMTLGRWPVVGLATARIAASEALEAVAHGDDPGAEKLRAKAARRQETDRDTLGALVELFYRRHLSTLKSGDQAMSFLRLHVLPKWGKRNIRTIERRDVIDLLDGIVDSGKATTANRVRAHLSKFFNWCVSRDIIEISPVLGVAAPAKENVRDRVLSDAEIRWFWRACEDIGQPWGPFGKLLILTGQRRREVANMTEAEIDGDTWRLTPDRTKNGRAHDVHLSKAALDVLAGVERIKSRSGFVHTTTGVTPVSGFQVARNNLALRMQEIADQERGEKVEIPRWTFHDVRRTAATGMARLGIPVRVTEAVLNHVSGTAAGIVSVYQRYDYAEEKRKALNAWGRFVLTLVEGGSDNVVRLEAGR